MKLELLDIDQFITSNNLKPVSSINIVTGNSFDASGLWSEDIFGLQTSKQRNLQFGYIDLKTKIIHPSVYLILVNTNTLLKKCINGTTTCILNSNGKLVENPNGHTGLAYFLSIFDKYSFTKNSKKNKLDDAKYLDKNKDKILIDKWLVIPAGIRDINLDKSNKRNIIMSDINTLYIDLIKTVDMYTTMSTVDTNEMLEAILSKIQIQLNNIYNWITNKMKGKRGLFRSSMMKKSTDYCARGVITSDPNIKLGHIGIPWHVVLVVFEPYFIHYLTTPDGKETSKLIAEYLKVDNLDYATIKQFTVTINRNYKSLPDTLVYILISVAKQISTDKNVLFKRDPVVLRSNWQSAKITVLESGDTFVLSPAVCSAIGGDFDGDTVAVYPLFSKEANVEAERINPIVNKSVLHAISNMGKLNYNLTLESISAIYEATRV